MVLLFRTWILIFLFPFAGEMKGSVEEVLNPHPFHISVTEINHNSKEKSLEISCKFFADDFEQTLEKNYKTSLDITAAKDKALLDKYIPDYISRHLVFVVDGRLLKLSYVGYENEKESVYCYLEVSNVAAVKRAEVTNSLLQDFSSDQINIIHFTVNGKRQSTKLDYPATKASFQF